MSYKWAHTVWGPWLEIGVSLHCQYFSSFIEWRSKVWTDHSLPTCSQRTLRLVLGCMSSHAISVWRTCFHFFGINTWQRDAGECGRAHRCRLCLLSVAAASSVFQLHCQLQVLLTPGVTWFCPPFWPHLPTVSETFDCFPLMSEWCYLCIFLSCSYSFFLVCCSNTVLPIKNTSLLSF